ncbi:uncharacterized protein BYT42DRAFT_601943 [Radiomyces spectabilis]|uniref:uncharacterized protein n=1 Tax=Radiomyces spectabilis TaxID=64574 RepID=UPI00222039CF|nr:uncharacterized protein BYT42DRAFT_601943 [Radiomyces spectabilis]KAI8390994.1 hypothetical protein BYT42DRAFT_601943 [Radiomyces spectabilis]
MSKNDEPYSENLPSKSEAAMCDKNYEEHMKYVEAKTAVVLLKDSRLCTKNEYTQWILKTIFQPLLKRKYETMDILYLSRNRRRIWKTDTTNHNHERGNTSRASLAQHPVPEPSKPAGHTYVLTPRTNIMTLTSEYRMVYVIDLSSSLATVGNARAEILLSEVFRTLRNSLEAVVQPFSLQVSNEEKIVFRPSIRLTVIADCSQFASNVNIMPMLVEHPTMRVFMQNAVISAQNIHGIIKKLYAEFLAFQRDITDFRKFLKRKRSHMGYELDVGGEVLDATSMPVTASPTESFTETTTSNREERSPKRIASHTRLAHRSNHAQSQNASPTSLHDVTQRRDTTSYHSSKKEVWGIGKSGASLSRILHAAHFALKLLPHDGRPQLVLITDGAMKSKVQDNTFVRQFADEDITCHIVQIGCQNSFIPGINFGFVPDTEILKFLSRATGGTFVYSEQCVNSRYSAAGADLPPDLHDLQKEDDPSNLTTNDDVSTTRIQTVPRSDTTVAPPNAFHQMLLFRETALSNPSFNNPFQSNNRDASQMNITDRGENAGIDIAAKDNFPWDPYAKPPQDEWRLLKYREYPLSCEFSHIIAARSREGFDLQTIIFEDGTGGKRSDWGIESLETIDLANLRKERVQMTMVLQWQPNIAIEYRIRATWLPAVGVNSAKSEIPVIPSNFFARAKAPRAEIFVRTDAEFAHMLQNWDVFRRRAQMMGVVTGSTYFGEAYAAPAYAKIEKLKAYLVDIFEGDEALKGVVGFNSRFLLNNTAMDVLPLRREEDGRTTVAPEQKLFFEEFHRFWERMNTAGSRERTRCWYDHDCIDLLIGDVSPYMSPKLASNYNQEFVLNVESIIFDTMEHIREILRDWADFESKDGTLVRMMHQYITTASTHDDSSKECLFTLNLSFPPSFCELRFRREYGRLMTIRLLFFNVNVASRIRATKHIRQLLRQLESTAALGTRMCARPFSRLLMRDPKHFQELSAGSMSPSSKGGSVASPTHRPRSPVSGFNTWYLPVAMWLTSEYIVRDYLRHMTWSWQTDNHQDQYHKDNRMMPIHDLAFQFLCQARLDQGYQLVSPRPDSTHFYQEISLPTPDNKSSLCAIQYFIWKDSNSGKITTELWMEPAGKLDFDYYDLVKRWTVEPDRKTISQLVTFDQMHMIGRSKSKGDFKMKRAPSADIPPNDGENATMMMMLPQLFDVASVLRSNKFAIASFKAPQFETQQFLNSPLPESNILQVEADDTDLEHPSRSRSDSHILLKRQRHQNLKTVGIAPTFHQPSMVKEICLRPDPVLNRNKTTIAQLDVLAQNYSLLHYFMEHSLSNLADGEILMSYHDMGTEFWVELKKAVEATSIGQCSNTHLVTDLTQMRCFIIIFDVRSFVVILFPGLETVAASLSKASSSDIPRRKMDLFMFECFRQKPMRPSKSTFLFDKPLEEANRLRLANMSPDDSVTIVPVNHLVHVADGLGEVARPQLYEGYFKSGTGHSSLSERTLRVAQDVARIYSRSFFRSFYSCLLRDVAVDDADLPKILEICHESSMEIDITPFINTMVSEYRSNDNTILSHEDIQDKFNAIVRQYFAPLKTISGRNSYLYYYKPPFAHLSGTLDQGSLDEKISFLIDLVAYTQTPLLMRLECHYEAINEKGDITSMTVPVSSIPLSYEVHTADNRKYNFTPNTMGNEELPLYSKDASVRLHLTCLSMTTVDDAKYFHLEPSMQFAKQRFLDPMATPPACFSSLNQEQQAALAETEARIRWLLTEEIIHGFLQTPNITKPILDYVVDHLSYGSPFIDFPTVINVPFRYVKNPTKTRQTFMEEFEKRTQRSDCVYKFTKVDGCFYISEDYTCTPEEKERFSLSTPVSPIKVELADRGNDLMSVGEKEAAAQEREESQDTDYCEGLGISLTPPQMSSKAEQDTPRGRTSNDRRPPYWLIIVPREHNVQIYFYSKYQMLRDRYAVIKRTKDVLQEIQERTNQLILLENLQETRLCSHSKFLEPPIEGYDDSVSESEDNEEKLAPMPESEEPLAAVPQFEPGHFRCPMVFLKKLALHPRLQPEVAIKYLKADVLQLFLVRNRPNMFVIEREGSIVYCRIFEQAVPVPTSNDDEVEGEKKVGKEQEDTEKVQETNGGKTATTQAKQSSKSGGSEERELVVEVHGIELPSWIENEFMDLIENRLMSHITLNEIQQFFLRNPTSKPTAADVHFVFPFDKPPMERECFRIPDLVKSPYTLITFFKQVLMGDNIRPFNGSNVVQAVADYYERAFHQKKQPEFEAVKYASGENGNENFQGIALGELCFYYNCSKRVPGTSTSLELTAGQGFAGICITVVDDTGMPVSLLKEAQSSGANFDPEVIKSCLRDEFRDATVGLSRYHVWIDVWTMGSTDGGALMQYIYDCYRQSLCDYFIEKVVTIDLGAALSEAGALQRAITAKSDQRLSTVVRNKFIESVLFILEKATEWKSSTVHSMDHMMPTMPWGMDDIVNYLDVELRKIDALLRPTVAWTSLGSDLLRTEAGDEHATGPPHQWEIYRGQAYRHRQQLQRNIQLVAISGLNEFVEKLGSVSSLNRPERRTSVASDESSVHGHSRHSSVSDLSKDIKKVSKVEEKSLRSGEQSRSSSIRSRSLSGTFGAKQRSVPQMDPMKHCFLIMTLDVNRLAVYSYNWSESISRDIFDKIYRVALRQTSRKQVLDNILCQKMGLFHHIDSIHTIIENQSALMSLSDTSAETPVTASASSPQVMYASPRQPKKPRSTDALSRNDLPTSGSVSRRSTTDSVAANIADLKDMILYPTVVLSRDIALDDAKLDSETLDTDTENISSLQTPLQRAELDHALMDSTAISPTPREQDILRRHGQPFLEAYLRRTKLQVIHQKALQVYAKWRKRYGAPEMEMDQAEKLTRAEVATILRTSRLLHFCRTRLLFFNRDKEWADVEDATVAKETAIVWYQTMASALMSEYAAYLERLDMQFIDFGNSEIDDVDSLNPSSFAVAKNMTLHRPSTYLLRVFEGGSIICEIRLTSVFVSVTLYTLHRQYGRMDYRRFHQETRAKKRLNFQNFEASCGQFKQLIHINSFVYDFHLRYIQQSLETNARFPQGLNLLEVIRKFAYYYRIPAPYSHNRMIHGFYEVETNTDINTFFENLFKNAPRHGLSNILVDNKYVGASVTSDDFSFSSTKHDAASKWRYSLVICPMESDEDELANPGSESQDTAPASRLSNIGLEYFILIVKQGDITPESMSKPNRATGEKAKHDPMDEIVLPEEGHTLKDIVQNTRNRLDVITSEVIMCCKRIHDWKQLYSAETSDNSLSGDERPDLVQLMDEFDRIDITAVDDNMATLFRLKLDWNVIFDIILYTKKGSAKCICKGGRRHLLIYSARYMDYMIHLQLNSSDQIEGWMVSRETRKEKTRFEGAELEQIANLGRIFCYFMWRQAVADDN